MIAGEMRLWNGLINFLTVQFHSLFKRTRDISYQFAKLNLSTFHFLSFSAVFSVNTLRQLLNGVSRRSAERQRLLAHRLCNKKKPSLIIPCTSFLSLCHFTAIIFVHVRRRTANFSIASLSVDYDSSHQTMKDEVHEKKTKTWKCGSTVCDLIAAFLFNSSAIRFDSRVIVKS